MTSGPYRFVSYAPSDNVVLEANEDYFKDAGPGVPILTEAQLQTLLNGGKLGIPLPDRNPIR